MLYGMINYVSTLLTLKGTDQTSEALCLTDIIRVSVIASTSQASEQDFNSCMRHACH